MNGAVRLFLAASVLVGCPSAAPASTPPPMQAAVDATATLQAAIDRAAPGSVVRLPRGMLWSGNLVIENKRDIEIRGEGTTIVWTGAAEANARVGFELRGDVRRVRIVGVRMIGDGDTRSRHAGVWNRSGQRIEDVAIVGNTIEDVTLGISFNADLGGHLARVRVADNAISNVVGTEPGYGYGIHVASGQPDPIAAEIVGNTIRAAQRHAIYQARGTGAAIRNNRVLDHRVAVANGALRPAIVIARAHDIEVVGNLVRGHADGGILVTTGTAPTDDVTVVGNTLLAARNAVPSIVVGSQDPSREGSPARVRIEANRVEHGDVRGEALRIYGADDLRVVDNVFVAGLAEPRSPAIGRRCDCTIVLERNVLDGG